jgi:hypothetical protein
MIKKLWDSAVAAAERYRELPDKFIDTNILMFGQIFICVIIGVAVLPGKYRLTEIFAKSCVLPLFYETPK